MEETDTIGFFIFLWIIVIGTPIFIIYLFSKLKY